MLFATHTHRYFSMVAPRQRWHSANSVIRTQGSPWAFMLLVEDSHRVAVEKLSANLFPTVPIPEVKSKWTQ